MGTSGQQESHTEGVFVVMDSELVNLHLKGVL